MHISATAPRAAHRVVSPRLFHVRLHCVLVPSIKPQLSVPTSKSPRLLCFIDFLQIPNQFRKAEDFVRRAPAANSPVQNVRFAAKSAANWGPETCDLPRKRGSAALYAGPTRPKILLWAIVFRLRLTRLSKSPTAFRCYGPRRQSDCETAG